MSPDQITHTGQWTPINLGEPIDPITGLPLRMTSLAGSPGPAGNPGSGPGPVTRDPTPNLPLPIDTPPAFPGTPTTDRADTAQQPAGQTHMQQAPPGPVVRPDRLIPALPVPPQTPLIPPSIIDPFQHKDLRQNRRPGSGPVQFYGGIEIPDADDPLDFPSLPAPDPLIPLPRLDPPLFDYGNADGELDWIDLIEEYAGRATRGGVPRDPAYTPPHERSWLRWEHWRVDATADASGTDKFGLATGYAGVSVGLGKIRGVTITPSASWHEALGTAKDRLAQRLYDLEIEAAWMHQLDERWRMRLEVGAGLYSDFEIDENLDALRLTSLGIFSYEWHPNLQLVLGVAWLNLETQEFYPVGGVIWQPDNHLQFEILFPEFKLAGFVKEVREGEIWSYIGGGFYGRTWRVQRSTGLEDDATYSNWRVYLGWEKRHVSGMTYFGEIGYVFDRRLRFKSDVGDFDADEVFFGRVGLTY